MRVLAFILAFAGLLATAFALGDYECGATRGKCLNSTSGVMCYYHSGDKHYFNCADGQHCTMHKLQHYPYCTSSNETSSLAIAPAKVLYCVEGRSYCANSTTGVRCLDGQEWPFITCSLDQYCTMNPEHETPYCKAGHTAKASSYSHIPTADSNAHHARAVAQITATPEATAMPKAAALNLVLEKANCTEGEYFCADNNEIMKCIGGQGSHYSECPLGSICKEQQYRPIPQCEWPDRARAAVVAGPSATFETVAAHEAVSDTASISQKQDDSICKEGEYFCSSRTTASLCVNGTAQRYRDCPKYQHCEMMPHRPWPRCNYDKRELSDALSTLTDVDARDIPITLNEVSTEGACANGQLWSRRRECYTCENGKKISIKHCRRNYHCHINNGEAQCGRSGPNDDWDKRSTVNVDEVDESNSPTLTHRQETTCAIDGEQYCCGKHMACKCQDNFEWVIDYCGTTDCVMDGNKAVCESGLDTTINSPPAAIDPILPRQQGEPSPEYGEYCCGRFFGCKQTNGGSQVILSCLRNVEGPPFYCDMNKGRVVCRDRGTHPPRGVDVTTRPDVAALISAHTTTLSTREDGTYCGFCACMYGQNVPLRTSGSYHCRNHPEVDGEYAVCRNQWCGLCVLFSERDCQGEIKWSGGRGQASGDRKGQHAKSHFCM